MPRLLLVGILALGACYEVNNRYCENPAHADDPHCVDAGMKCTSRDMCSSAMPVCDLTDNGGTCVACTQSDPGACSGTMPVCSADHTCIACTTDLQCNGVCLPSGACAATSDLIYVAPLGDDLLTCDGTAVTHPCSLRRGLEIAAGAATRNVIVMAMGTYAITGSAGWLIGGTATLDARNGVDFDRSSGDGVVITVAAAAHVTLLGGRVHGGQNDDGIKAQPGSVLTMVDTTVDQNDQYGINCDQCTLHLTTLTMSNNSKNDTQHAAIFANAGSTLEVARSTFTLNRGGAISAAGKFVIVNNFIYNNGDATSPIGGISIATSGSATNQLDFNSIVRNTAQSGPGIKCDAGVGFVARNNIVWNNNLGVGAQVANSCQYAFCDVGPLPLVTANDAGNNMPDDPKVKDEIGNLHLQAGVSPVTDKADPAATMAIDADGDARPQPAGQRADIGADEIP